MRALRARVGCGSVRSRSLASFPSDLEDPVRHRAVGQVSLPNQRIRAFRYSGLSPLADITAQSAFAGADHRLRPVGHLKLEQDVRDMIPYRLEAHEQLSGYLLVALALCHE
jgi:hypothetical protein